MAASPQAAGNTPQAADDFAFAKEDTALTIDVTGNDKGGNAISLYSLHQTSPTLAATTGLSKFGAAIQIVNGKVVYDASGSATLQALAAGAQVVDTFTYAIRLGNGTVSVAKVSVTVTGSNDAPVVRASGVMQALEDAAPVAQSALANASDIDNNAALTVVLPSALPAGVRYDAATRSFVLDPRDAAFQALRLGESATVTVNYGVSDGTATTAASLSWQVAGRNDLLASDVSFTGATGAGGSYRIGDTVTVSVGAGGVAAGGTVFVDFSAFGGPAQVAAVLQGGNYVASFVAQAAAGGASASAVVTLDSGNGDIVKVSSAAVRVDFSAPTGVAAGDIAITGGSGAGGAFRPGDTIRAVVDPAGLNGSLDGGGVSVSFADFGGSLVTATLVTDPASPYLGKYLASHVVPSSASADASAQVRITITDGAGNSLVVESNPVAVLPRTAPVATPVTLAAGTEDAAYSIQASALLANASDADGDALAIKSLELQSGGGTLTGSAQTGWTYTPDANANGAVTFGYVVTDGQSDARSSALLQVAAVNDAPVVLSSASAAATEDGAAVALQALANASDVDDAVLSVVLPSALPAGVSYDAATRSFALDPRDAAFQALRLGETATVTVNYGVSDGTATTAASLSWQVAGRNDLLASDVTFGGATGSDGAFRIGDTVTVSVGAAGFAAGGTVLVDFSAFGGPAQVAAVLQDGRYVASFVAQATAGGATASAVVTLDSGNGDIVKVSSAPVSVDFSAPAGIDAGSVFLTGGSGAGGAFRSGDTIRALVDPAGLDGSLDGGMVRVAFDDFGGSTVTAVRVTDPASPDFGKYLASFLVPAGVAADAAARVTITVTDAAGNALVVESNPVAVTPRTAPTVAALALAAGTEDTPYILQAATLLAAASDADGDALQVTGVTVASGGGSIVRAADGASWTYTPAANYFGTVEFGFTVSDGTTTAHGVATLALADAPDGPGLVLGPVAGGEDSAIALGIVASGATPGEAVTVTIAGLPAGAKLANAAGDTFAIVAGSVNFTAAKLAGLSFTAPAEQSGVYTLGVTVSSASGTVSQPLTVTVAAVNDAPVFASTVNSQVAVAGTAYSYTASTALVTDVDNAVSSLAWSAALADGSALPSWLSFDSATLKFSGIASAAHIGNLSVALTARDPAGLAASTVFTLTVAPAGAITATLGNDSVPGTEGNDIIYVLAGNDSVQGRAGADLIYGQEGNDTLSGDAGVDKLYGGPGDDVLYTGPSGAGETGDEAYGEAGKDTLYGGNSGAITLLDGGDGDDTIFSPQVGRIYGGAGNDKLQTYLIYSMPTGTFADGGDGFDTLEFSTFSGTTLLDFSRITNFEQMTNAAGTITLADVTTAAGVTMLVQTRPGSVLTLNGSAETDGFLNVVGSTAADVLTGGARNDTLVGGAGDDTLRGNAGNDVLEGGDGNDLAVYAGKAADYTVATDAATRKTTVTHLAGTDGVDTLSGVNRLQFSDQTIALTIIGDNKSLDGANNNYTGTEGDDTIRALAGNDTVSGLLGADVLYGDDGNDTLSGDAGVDKLYGGNGDDVLYTGTSGTGETGDEAYGEAGKDTLYGGNSGAITLLDGGDGDDTIFSPQVGRIYGGAGNDKLQTYLIYSMPTGTFADGGDGFDTLEFSTFSGATLLDFSRITNFEQMTNAAGTIALADVTTAAGVTMLVQTRSGSVLTLNGSAETDGFLNVVGSTAADVLTGGARNDTLVGGAGDDTLRGNAGDDVLDGGDGNDLVVYAGKAADYTVTTDATTRKTTVTHLAGTDGVDTLSGVNRLQFSDQTIALTIIGDNKSLDGANNNYTGTEGDDTIRALAGNDTVSGLLGADVLYGDDGNDTLSGDAGVDKLYGGNGDDVLYTGTSGTGETGDEAYGEAGKDTLYGGNSGAITLLDGGDGDDTIFSPQVGRIYGGAGNDKLQTYLIYSMPTGTFADGGDGFDTLEFSTFSGATLLDFSRITNFEQMTNAAGTIALADVTTAAGVTMLVQTRSGSVLTLNGSAETDGFLNVVGSTAADVLTGGARNDTLVGGAGDDTLRGNAGDDVLDGGDGNDIAVYAGSSAGYIMLPGTAADALTVTARTGSEGKDTLTGVNRLQFGGEVHTILVMGIGTTVLAGTSAHEILVGNAFDEALSGGAGNDRLLGNGGNDTLTGGAGADIFIFHGDSGQDTVLDFSVEDKLQLSIAAPADVAAWLASNAEASGADTLLRLDGTNTVRLVGVAPGALMPDALDFAG